MCLPVVSNQDVRATTVKLSSPLKHRGKVRLNLSTSLTDSQTQQNFFPWMHNVQRSVYSSQNKKSANNSARGGGGGGCAATVVSMYAPIVLYDGMVTEYIQYP